MVRLFSIDLISGNYFANEFVMGNESFPSMNPEAFLFGDMADLQYLSRFPGSVCFANRSHARFLRLLHKWLTSMLCGASPTFTKSLFASSGMQSYENILP